MVTKKVFAYESEGEDSDTEDNIIKPDDHVLLTCSTEEVCPKDNELMALLSISCRVVCCLGRLRRFLTQRHGWRGMWTILFLVFIGGS